jgi:hypothetical protein
MQPEHEQPFTRSDGDERSLARLLKLSGERGMPAARASARAKAAALEAWESSLRTQRSQHRRKLLACAAAVSLITIGAIVWLAASVRDSSTLIDARLAMLWGDAAFVDRSGQASLLTDATGVATGTQIHTHDGRVALTFGDSLSLRVNVNSRLRFDSEEQITLVSGAIYVDSGGLSTGSDLRIITPAGEVMHQGTQYLVSVSPGATRIVVREGRVQLEGPHDQTQVTAGERIDIDEAGRISRAAAPTFGGSWEWVSMIVPSIDLDNRPLGEFLSWMIREHGWQLRYATASDEQTAQSIRLHASAQGKTPLETLQRVSLITGLTMDVENGVLIVGDRDD